MKTRLFYILLLVSSISFAQNWSQVGNAQFSEFAADVGKIAFNPNNGDVYVLYKKPSSTGLYVMKYDGTTWANVGTTSVSNNSTTYNTYAININPTTNEPWVVLKRAASGAASSYDVYNFDGTNWTQKANGVTGISYTIPNQIHFSSTGTPRFARVAHVSGANRRLGLVTYSSGTSWSSVVDGFSGRNYNYDYTSYNEYFICSNTAWIRKRSAVSGNLGVKKYSGKSFKAVSGIADSNHFVAYDGVPTTTGTLLFDDFTNAGFSQPGGTVKGSANIKFRKSNNDNNFYLMYNNNADAITFKKYIKNSDTWVTLSDINVSSTANNFFVDMGINPHDGNMYAMYLDGAKISVKKFTIATPPALPRIYVDATATGNSTGESWVNAFTSLQDALANIQNVTTEIWIAKGTYKPGASRTSTFEITKNDLAIYGGFAGTETNISDRDMSLIHTTNSTILSGDANGNDAPLNPAITNSTRNDNNYHVVTLNANNVVIDGVTIQDGYANQPSGVNSYGASVNVAATSENFILRNCEVKDNLSMAGALRAYFSVNTQFTVENCTFTNNHARYGSGLYVLANNNATVTVNITNTLFTNSSSKDIYTSASGYTGSSAWIRAYGSNSTVTTNIVNCTFANNRDNGNAVGTKGTLALSKNQGSHTATISNSIFYGNTRNAATTSSVNQGHTSPATVTVYNSIGEDNFSNLTYLTNTSNTNPNLTTDFKLQASSTAAINAGDNSKIPSGITKDLAGNDRIINTTVDMGAYEYKANTCTNIVNIPNANFKAALLAHGVSIKGRGISKIDTNNDGVICTDEAQAYTGKIHIYNKSINDLTGIEAFTSITELLCNNNQLTSLDVTKNTRLQRLYCNNNRLTNLDVTKNTSLMYLYCNNNRLTNLDVTKNTSLRYLYCNNNQLTSLNLTKNTSLQRLYCSNNQLTSLNVTKNTILQGLYCYNNKLTNVDITKNTRLRYLYCYNNKLTNVDVTKNTRLSRLYCHNNQLTNLNVTKNTSLQRLYCNNNQLTSLNIANGNNGASSSKLRYVTATNNPNLTCIQHDTGFDPTTNRNWRKDTTANWSTNCASASINDEVYNNAISMYPNPVRTTLNISSKNVAIEKVAIYNLLGKKVVESTQTNINVNNLNRGVYILKVQSRDNKIAVKKFIKE